jgi:hypothetical protein
MNTLTQNISHLLFVSNVVHHYLGQYKVVKILLSRVARWMMTLASSQCRICFGNQGQHGLKVHPIYQRMINYQSN